MQGRSYLAFSLPSRTLCNTWFLKKEIHRLTWQQPISKHWSFIDYLIMRQSYRRMCSDVTVKRSAECSTSMRMT